MKNIIDIIKPENDIEKLIISDEEFIIGVLWGEPRNGHPEGKIIYHIQDILKNIDKYSDNNNRNKLRLIALIHDTFKFKVDKTRPKFGENHHGMIARRFAEKYIDDTDILDIIELHDEAYNSWRKGIKKNDWISADKRIKNLINRIYNFLDLYLTFYKCDNSTGFKDSNDYKWFERKIIEFDFDKKMKESIIDNDIEFTKLVDQNFFNLL